MATQVRLTITISEKDMVKLRIAAARQHMAASTLARVYVQSRLAQIHIVEPVLAFQPPLGGEDRDEGVPF